MTNSLAPLWHVGDDLWSPALLPRLMGILNVTPDSFSDGGRYQALEAALAQGERLAEEGADILDLGGESTRPGSLPVPAEEELRRVLPVIEALAGRPGPALSIDTTKADVAEAALRAGVRIVNDISGLQFDPRMLRVCAEHGAAVVINHIQGTPETMQRAPAYEDVVAEVRAFFLERIDACVKAGIRPERICLDPGIGFGKTAEHNVELLAAIPEFRALGRPVLIGHSRKQFIKRILGRPLDERLQGTVGVTLAVAHLGADVVRVHDVAANRDALLAYSTVVGRGRDRGTALGRGA